MATKLSVNINKWATLRNARGGNNPDLLKTAQSLEAYGAQGITVHPRPDQRHIKYQDARRRRIVFRLGQSNSGERGRLFRCQRFECEIRPYRPKT